MFGADGYGYVAYGGDTLIQLITQRVHRTQPSSANVDLRIQSQRRAVIGTPVMPPRGTRH